MRENKSGIPIHKCPDPFMMNENDVNNAVAIFFKQSGVKVQKLAINTQTGIDVLGTKDGYTLIVESKGSMANKQNEYVFGNGQIKKHVGVQLYYLIKQFQSSTNKTLLILANPDIPRIRNCIDDISRTIEILGFIKMWVKEDKSAYIESPEIHMATIEKLGLLPNLH